jgi:hypothetical protein
MILIPEARVSQWPSGFVWTESSPDMPCLNSTMIISILATHSVNRTVLFKYTPLCTSSKMHSCTFHATIPAPRNGFHCTYLHWSKPWSTCAQACPAHFTRDCTQKILFFIFLKCKHLLNIYKWHYFHPWHKLKKLKFH